MIDQKSGRIRKIATQAVPKWLKCGNGLHGGIHVTQPGFTLGKPDLERDMPQPQTRMTTFFLITQGTAKALDQEPCEMHLGVCQVRRVKGPQNKIRFHALIKGFDKCVKGLIIADSGINFSRFIIHSQVEARTPLQHKSSIPDFHRISCSIYTKNSLV